MKPSCAGPQLLTYDQTGNVIRRRKPDLCELEHDYDAMGRLVVRRTQVGNSYCTSPIDDAFGYDARGLLVAAQNDDVGLIREYDPLGRMLREIDTRFGTGVGYAYDSASRLTAKVYPDGSAVHYAYDGAGRTVGISDPFGDTTRFVYDAAGRRVQKLGTDGVRTDYTYNATTRFLSSVANSKPGLPFALVLSYPSHDNVGNRLASSGFGGTTAYTYDQLDRLATLDPPDEAIYPANGALTEFAYDAAGNRTDFGPKAGSSFVSPHTTYSYDPANRLKNIKVDGATAETLSGYDGNGNPATWTPPAPNDTARSLKYDALGRLVSISGGFSASYVYDPFGRRIEKTEATVTTRYQYDGLDVVAEYSASQLEATYVFGPGIDEVLKLERGGVEAEYHTDGLGSVLAISSGATYRNTYRYDAFGQVVATGGSQPLANAYIYTGRERDASGLYYYRARYYLPSAGRFLTPDPIGLAGGLNAYAYVGSNPVNYTDPFGLRAGAPLGPAGPRLPGARGSQNTSESEPRTAVWGTQLAANRESLDEAFPQFDAGQGNQAFETNLLMIDSFLATGELIGRGTDAFDPGFVPWARASKVASRVNIAHGSIMSLSAAAHGDPFAASAYLGEVGIGVIALWIPPVGLAGGAAFFATDVAYPGGVGGFIRDRVSHDMTYRDFFGSFPNPHPLACCD